MLPISFSAGRLLLSKQPTLKVRLFPRKIPLEKPNFHLQVAIPGDNFRLREEGSCPLFLSTLGSRSVQSRGERAASVSVHLCMFWSCCVLLLRCENHHFWFLRLFASSSVGFP